MNMMQPCRRRAIYQARRAEENNRLMTMPTADAAHALAKSHVITTNPPAVPVATIITKKISRKNRKTVGKK